MESVLDKRDRIKAIFNSQNNEQKDEKIDLTQDVKVENAFKENDTPKKVDVIEENQVVAEQKINQVEQPMCVDKPVKKKKIWSTVLSIALSCLIIFGYIAYNNCLFGLNTKVYDINNGEIQITLKGGVEIEGSLNASGSYYTGVKVESKYIAMQILRHKTAGFEGCNAPNLTEYAYIDNADSLTYNKDKKLCYETDGKKNSHGQYNVNYYFKTSAGYYSFYCYYEDNNKAKLDEAIDSIKFSSDKIYDIDETITDKKEIALGVDSAKITIPTNLLKVDGEEMYVNFTTSLVSNEYSIEYDYILKSNSGVDSLVELVEKITTDYTVTDDYIKFSGRDLERNYLTYYYYETTNYYIELIFVSNSDKTFDSYASTFTAN